MVDNSSNDDVTITFKRKDVESLMNVLVTIKQKYDGGKKVKRCKN